ncbi:hypothetical protein D9M70_631370 [compost metagenome]
MVGKLGDHDVSQQPGGRDALVDNLCRYWRLDQRFALITDPLATHMALDGKHAGGVVQFLADIFTDALEGAATGAVCAVRFVLDQRARKLRWQRRALGLLLRLGRHQGRF